jgi:hypothetical protein
MKFESKYRVILAIFLSVTTTILIVFSILWRKGIIGSDNISKGNTNSDDGKSGSFTLENNINKSSKTQAENRNQKPSGSKADKGGGNDPDREGDKNPETETEHMSQESSGRKADDADTFSYKDIFADGDPSTWDMHLQKLNDRYNALLSANHDKIDCFHKGLQSAFKTHSVDNVIRLVGTADDKPDADFQIIIDLAKLLANIYFYEDLINYKSFQEKNPKASNADLENFVSKSKKVKTHSHGFLLVVARSRIAKKCPSRFINITNNTNPKEDPNEFVSEVKDELSKEDATANSCRPLLMLSLYHHYFYVHTMNDSNFPVVSKDSTKVNSSKKNIEALEKVLGKVCKQI